MVLLATLSITLGLSTTALAHGWIDWWTISGVNYTGYNPTVAPWVPDQGTITWPAWNTDTGPVYSKYLNGSDIICSTNATNSKLYGGPIAAGDTVDLHWTVWPESHHGPILTYIADCGEDCTTVNKEELRWVKIAEASQISYGAGGGKVGRWPDDELREANGSWAVTIPSSIKAGKYVLRNEVIALHSAYDLGEAQLYPQCANIEVTGNGTATVHGVLGRNLYRVEDPGLHYNIYNDEQKPNYPVPGPKLFDGLSANVSVPLKVSRIRRRL